MVWIKIDRAKSHRTRSAVSISNFCALRLLTEWTFGRRLPQRSALRIRLRRCSMASSVFVRTPHADAVGTGITPRPPHRSVRAELPHTAPTLGDGDSTSTQQRFAMVGHRIRTHSRLKVRGTLSTFHLPLVCRLPSTTSADQAFQPNLCSAASSVLRSSPTSQGRISSAYAYWLPDALCASRRRSTLGSPGSRVKCFLARMRSQTA